jgi:hypothetical protein
LRPRHECEIELRRTSHLDGEAKARTTMAKEKNTGGEKKGRKKAGRTLKEKRAAKRAKKS